MKRRYIPLAIATMFGLTPVYANDAQSSSGSLGDSSATAEAAGQYSGQPAQGDRSSTAEEAHRYSQGQGSVSGTTSGSIDSSGSAGTSMSGSTGGSGRIEGSAGNAGSPSRDQISDPMMGGPAHESVNRPGKPQASESHPLRGGPAHESLNRPQQQ